MYLIKMKIVTQNGEYKFCLSSTFHESENNTLAEIYPNVKGCH